MLTLIIVLSLAGTIGLVLEVFLPGGILGIAGGLLIALAIALTLGSSSLGDISTAGRLAAATAILAFNATAFTLTLKYFSRTRLGKLITLQSASTATTTPSFHDLKVGALATATTDLTPIGTIFVDGRSIDALSESGFVPSGATLRVTRIESGTIYVVES